MSYNINIHVNKNGKLETEEFPLELSVYRESRRVKLLFTVDNEIDSTYHYLKLTHRDVTYLYRVHNNAFEIPKAITAYEGRWELSFVACDEPANSDSTITADYIYASEPIVCDVVRGNLGIVHTSEEYKLLIKIVEGTFDRFEIPSGAEYICANFLANISNEFTVFVPTTIKNIKSHAFYDSGCASIEFEPGSQLTTLEANALYRITNLGNINFPASLSTWGNYNLSYCGCERITFEANSNLRNLGNYSFWNIPNLVTLELPDRLQTLSGGTAVIKGCPNLEELWIPNSLTSPIPQNAIEECPLLSRIILQSNFNVAANFGNVTALTRNTVIAMFRALKDLSGSATKTISLHTSVISRLESEDIEIATSKNWSVGEIGGEDVLDGATFHYENSSVSMDISFSNGTGTITNGTATASFQYEYPTSTTFKLTFDSSYVESQWGSYKLCEEGSFINDTGVITLSSGEASTVKFKTYSNTGVGTNRTFNRVREDS